jgi:AraC-like DNA-binding protein
VIPILRAGACGPIFPVMQDLLDAMCGRIARHTEGFRLETPIPRVAIGMARERTEATASLYEPMICLVLQGAKQVMIGDRMLRYDPASMFIASLELPASGRIIEASADKPYIVASLRIDREALADLIAGLPASPEGETAGFGVTAMTPDLLAAWAQLLALLDAPEDVPVLAPLREREILYRLLKGPQGGLLRQIARADSRVSRVRRAIQWLQVHFDQTMRIESLAEIAGMSVPSFHRHFKAATAMSPLQYQKTLRLQTARRLMMTSIEASRAAYSVGYESASQFSREYARMFGAPPSRDVERMRAEPVAV